LGIWQTTLAAAIGIALEGPSLAAGVISSDLIVIGNSCFGFDCATVAPVIPDALVLKENNTRIAFGIPNQPGTFRLVANASANGGANRFTIDLTKSAVVPVDAQPQVLVGAASFPTQTPFLMLDGRLRVPVNYAQIAPTGLTGNDAQQTTPPTGYYYVPAGAFTTGPGPTYTIATATPLQDLAGAPISDSFTYSDPVIGFDDTLNAVTLGQGSQAVNNSVSVGSVGALHKITNLGEGTQAQDILTYGQLTNAQNILNGTALAQMTTTTTAAFGRVNAVNAKSVALSALQVNPRAGGQHALSLGLGSYDGETAYALGTHFTLDNNITLSLGAASSGTTADLQVAVGIGYSW